MGWLIEITEKPPIFWASRKNLNPEEGALPLNQLWPALIQEYIGDTLHTSGLLTHIPAPLCLISPFSVLCCVCCCDYQATRNLGNRETWLQPVVAWLSQALFTLNITLRSCTGKSRGPKSYSPKIFLYCLHTRLKSSKDGCPSKFLVIPKMESSWVMTSTWDL